MHALTGSEKPNKLTCYIFFFFPPCCPTDLEFQSLVSSLLYLSALFCHSLAQQKRTNLIFLVGLVLFFKLLLVFEYAFVLIRVAEHV